MRIGLVRHFKVNLAHSRLVTSKGFQEWADKYDIADVIENEVNLDPADWDKCYSSDLPRAVKTAETIYNGEISKTPLLREVPMSPMFRCSIRLPHVFWSVFCRVAWFFSHRSQVERRKQTKKRIMEFLKYIEKEKDINILVVCHGFFMYFLQKELKKRGFQGKIKKRIKNGTLYVFER